MDTIKVLEKIIDDLLKLWGNDPPQSNKDIILALVAVIQELKKSLTPNK